MSDQRIWSVFKVGLAAAFFWAAAHSVHVSPAIADGGADAIADRFANDGTEPDAQADAAGSSNEPAETAAEREAETQALTDKLRDIRRKRSVETGKNLEELPAVPPALSRMAKEATGYISPLVEKHVTVLLVMNVGKTGVRRWSKTADPMLCVHENCYLSRGARQSAMKLPRSKAFGPTVALTTRGQACRSKPACIFRDIDLETVEAKLQPIDLKFLRHDRREAKAIRADASCDIIDGRLSCRNVVEGKSWKAWIVPESVAKRAGAAGLEQALQAGLK